MINLCFFLSAELKASTVKNGIEYMAWLADWYRHLIDLIGLYRSMLIQLPYLRKLGIDAIQLSSISRQVIVTDLKLGDNVHWYNPGQVVYYAFIKGIIKTDPDTGLRYYIDPISMFISNLDESQKESIFFYGNILNVTGIGTA